MALEVNVSVPFELLGLERYITEGWDAFFANNDTNPYEKGSLTWRAWRYGHGEAMDYGQ